MELTALHKQLLDIIQTDFPLCPRPYAELGARLGVTEQAALDAVNEMRHAKIIRRMGANFQSAKLGFRSTLCAAKVPTEQIDAFVATVNACPGVTHNYLRNHAYNIWFTLIGPSWENMCDTLANITQTTGIEILNLPATKLYKIKVNFAMEA